MDYIAWLLAQQGITAPVASATNAVQLQELLTAVQLQLDDASIVLLNQASDVE